MTTVPGRAQVPWPSSRGLVHHGDLVVNKAIESVDDLVYQPVGLLLDFQRNANSANYHIRVVELTEEDHKAMRLTTE